MQKLKAWLNKSFSKKVLRFIGRIVFFFLRAWIFYFISYQAFGFRYLSMVIGFLMACGSDGFPI